MRIRFFIIIFLTTLGVFAQQKEIDWEAVDSLYREDQFYFNFSYNSLQKRPPGIDQNKLSFGLSTGFLRDMPINKSRTVSIASGLGYTLAVYNYNLGVVNQNGINTYYVLDNYSTNKQSMHYVDLPIEFRWRNSTPESHKFWRIYPGFKMSYLFYDHYKSIAPTGNVKLSNNKDLNQLNYGLSLSMGWNTWNFYAYYGLNSIFKSSAVLDNQSLNMHTLNLGIMFYIL